MGGKTTAEKERQGTDASESVTQHMTLVTAFEKALAESQTIEQFREKIKPFVDAIPQGRAVGRRESPDSSTAVLSPQASRDALAWAVSTGSKVTVQEEGQDQTVQITRAEEIPVGELRIVGLILSISRDYTADDFRHVGAMKDLMQLNCHAEESVTDDCLAQLAGLKKLERLTLSSTSVTGSGLEHLGSLSNLQDGDFDDTAVNDEGLLQLGKLKSLTQLHLSNTQITDAGLAQLKSLNSLRLLNVTRTKVTVVGVEAFQKAQPKCRIIPTAAELGGTAAQFRTWHDLTSNRTVEAELVEVKDGRVTLKRADNGKQVVVALDRLSAEDQQFVKSSSGAAREIAESPFVGMEAGAEQVFSDQPRRNGSMPAEQARPLPTHSAQTQKKLVILPGMRKTRAAALPKSARRSRIPGACATCMATPMSGASTRRRQDFRFAEAGAGATQPRNAGRRPA